MRALNALIAAHADAARDFRGVVYSAPDDDAFEAEAAAIMRDAWRRYRDGQRLHLGWTFSRCLLVAWQAAKMRQRNPPERYGLTGATRQQLQEISL